MDRITKEHRSWNMSRIRNKDTTPEKTVRSSLHRMGYRYRLHRKDLPGHPDIVLPKYRSVIFVHGCYWHRHQGCRFAYTPKTRIDFWQRKFEENIIRDTRTEKSLRKIGWRVSIAWECEIRDLEALAERLSFLLKKEDQQNGNCHPRS